MRYTYNLDILRRLVLRSRDVIFCDILRLLLVGLVFDKSRAFSCGSLFLLDRERAKPMSFDEDPYSVNLEDRDSHEVRDRHAMAKRDCPATDSFPVKFRAFHFLEVSFVVVIIVIIFLELGGPASHEGHQLL